MIRIEGASYLAHRLAWLYVHGEWPKEEIDHVNGKKADNRIANLRDVSRQVNAQNERSARSTNQTGILGVSWDAEKEKFVAGIVLDGRRRTLGRCDNPADAGELYVAAKRQIHPGGTL